MNFEQTGNLIACLNGGMKKPLPELIPIANRLIATREAVGFVGWGRQGAYADAARLARNRYNQWEKGHVRPTEKGLQRLWVRFGVPPEWIWYGEPSRVPLDLAVKLNLVSAPESPPRRKTKTAA